RGGQDPWSGTDLGSSDRERLRRIGWRVGSTPALIRGYRTGAGRDGRDRGVCDRAHHGRVRAERYVEGLLRVRGSRQGDRLAEVDIRRLVEGDRLPPDSRVRLEGAR